LFHRVTDPDPTLFFSGCHLLNSLLPLGRSSSGSVAGFATDPDPWPCSTGLRIRMILFSSVANTCWALSYLSVGRHPIIPDPSPFHPDPDPRLCSRGLRIRILLFSSVADTCWALSYLSVGHHPTGLDPSPGLMRIRIRGFVPQGYGSGIRILFFSSVADTCWALAYLSVG
jgi:hypothetical protein